MQTDDFDYMLPDELIAKYPVANRTESRLLCLDGMEVSHRKFHQVIDLLNPGDLLVMNNSKVIPARLFGHKESGGKIEILLERLLDDHHALAHVRSSKSPKPGTILKIAEGFDLEVTGRQDALFELKFLSDKTALTLLEEHGHIPLPPYIDREDDDADVSRYQTVYADPAGSVAAPTAGLHFDEELLRKIQDKGVQCGFITLHVGAGTFQPVRVEDVTKHKMHSELISVSQALCDQIKQTKENGGRIIAVGTTTVRSLESASQTGELIPFEGETDIFIYPGFEFKCVDAMITNFHLPKSTLMMLVSAFAGYDNVMKAYEVAVEEKYRFYSYGDAMFIRVCP